VDVMLVVLIIFIVVTPLLTQGASVDLPGARNVDDVTADEERVLTVTPLGEGQLLLGADPIDPADLAARLQARRDADPSLQLRIRADRNLPYGEVKRVLGAAREAGFPGAALLAREVHPAESAGQGD
jgi:biopolymer transport protein ExbD